MDARKKARFRGRKQGTLDLCGGVHTRSHGSIRGQEKHEISSQVSNLLVLEHISDKTPDLFIEVRGNVDSRAAGRIWP